MCGGTSWNGNRNQYRHPQHQTVVKHPDAWQRDLNPNHMAGQNLGLSSEATSESSGTAFHLRKQGWNFGDLADIELKQIPVLDAGTRLQQGARYVDLATHPPQQFTATGEMQAAAGHAYAPKDRVPYEIWNRLIGEEKPGQDTRTL